MDFTLAVTEITGSFIVQHDLADDTGYTATALIREGLSRVEIIDGDAPWTIKSGDKTCSSPHEDRQQQRVSSSCDRKRSWVDWTPS